MDSYELRELAETLEGEQREKCLAAAREMERLEKEVKKKKSYRPDGSFLQMG